MFRKWAIDHSFFIIDNIPKKYKKYYIRESLFDGYNEKNDISRDFYKLFWKEALKKWRVIIFHCGT